MGILGRGAFWGSTPQHPLERMDARTDGASAPAPPERTALARRSSTGAPRGLSPDDYASSGTGHHLIWTTVRHHTIPHRRDAPDHRACPQVTPGHPLRPCEERVPRQGIPQDPREHQQCGSGEHSGGFRTQGWSPFCRADTLIHTLEAKRAPPLECPKSFVHM
jgi:hypothetical protein